MAIGAEIPFGWSVRSRRAIDDRFITADLTTRDALSTFRRHKNLEVFVESTNRSYYLDNDTTNSDWMEVLKSIDVLTEDSAITNDDFLVWFDESEKTHKKVKKLNFGASKWTAGTGDDIYRLLGNVGVGVNPTSKFHIRLPSSFPLYEFKFQTPTISGLLANSPEFAIGRVDNDNYLKFAPFAAGGSYPIIQSWGGALQIAFNKGTTGLLFESNKITYASASFIEHNTSNSYLTFQNSVGRYRFNRTNAGGNPFEINCSIANETEMFMRDLPTSDPLVANKVWSNGGVLTLSAG